MFQNHPSSTDQLTDRMSPIYLTVNQPTDEEQEDLLDLVTALLKFNCFLSTTVATQCTF